MISKEDLVGTWELESWTVGYSDRDEFSYPYGEEPRGLLVYANDGWMSASIARNDRAGLPTDISYRKIPDALKAEAFSSYFHYAGRFQVHGGDVVHYVTQSLNPDFPGTEQLRHAELDGQTLVLSGKDQVGEVVRFHSLVWHRTTPTPEPTEDRPPLDA
ncbi:lipocalin-like domain-containing protein [Halioglobus maricola]|nr:lipocalin-like domain-containing protein [Halioglobus maricola]